MYFNIRNTNTLFNLIPSLCISSHLTLPLQAHNVNQPDCYPKPEGPKLNCLTYSDIRRVFECIGFMIGKHWATGSALDGCMMFIDWGIRPHNSFIFILCNDCWASSSINMNNKQKRGAACALCGVFFWQFNSHPRIVLLRFWIFILFLSLWTVMLHIFWNGSLLSRTINIL